MKAQFKYALIAGGTARVGAVIVIFVFNLVSVILGALGLLPFAALVTAISLGGVGIAVMMFLNIFGDIAIIRRLFKAPGAYLYALTPVPRWKTLLASVVTIAVMDIVSMTVAITGIVWMSMILAGNYVGDIIGQAVSLLSPEFMLGFWIFAMAAVGYLLLMMVIIFCIALRKSVFYQKHGGGMLTLLVAAGILFIINLSPLLLWPFAAVSFRWMQFTVSLNSIGVVMYVLLGFAQAATLFVLTSRLMERKLNI